MASTDKTPLEMWQARCVELADRLRARDDRIAELEQEQQALEWIAELECQNPEIPDCACAVHLARAALEGE